MLTDGHYKATNNSDGAVVNLYCLHCDFIAWRDRRYHHAWARYGAMRAEMVKHLHREHIDKLREFEPETP